MGWRIKIESIRDVAEYQLCCGCGACAYISPDEIRMVDTLDYGRRPLLPDGPPRDPRTAEAMKVCPGIELSHTFDRNDPALIRELVDGWGPIREVWEGYAADPEIRFAGSSGGAATALALYCVDKLGFHGVLHIAARPDVPYLNRTVMSTTRAELLAATGSRYAPASPCDGLKTIEDAVAPCVFIGKPCDVAAVQKARKLRPALDAKIGLTIAIFCAGTPTTAGTAALLRAMGVDDTSTLVNLRYRGNGWPGKAVAVFGKNGNLHRSELTYEESWGDVLTKHRQWRCNLCPDHTGEFADIAVGDPWYRTPEPDESGRSLILVRTERGGRLLQGTLAGTYLAADRVGPSILPASQSNLLKTRGAVRGRLLTLRCLGVAAPRFREISMARSWWAALSIKQQLQSIIGTARRVHARCLRVRRPVIAVDADGPHGESECHVSPQQQSAVVAVQHSS